MKMTIHKTILRDFSEGVQALRLPELECPPVSFRPPLLLFESPMNIDESPLVSPVEPIKTRYSMTVYCVFPFLYSRYEAPIRTSKYKESSSIFIAFADPGAGLVLLRKTKIYKFRADVRKRVYLKYFRIIFIA